MGTAPARAAGMVAGMAWAVVGGHEEGAMVEMGEC